MVFWKSRAFWTVILGFAFNLLVGFKVIPVTVDVVMYSNLILGVLAGFFRWDAQAPLAATQAAADVKVAEIASTSKAVGTTTTRGS